jgi:hypothetical protein
MAARIPQASADEERKHLAKRGIKEEVAIII